jgi:uncharacterized protein
MRTTAGWGPRLTSRSGRLLFLLIATAPTVVIAPLSSNFVGDDILARTLLGLLATALPVALVTWYLWQRGESWHQFGLSWPKSWVRLSVQTFLVTAAALASFIFLIGPISQMTGARPDVSHLLFIRGNLPALIGALFVVWITAALFEEMFVRGYLLNEISNLLGGTTAAIAAGVLLSSLIFGFGHAYQGVSGIVITSMAGLIFGVAYILCGRNLWPVIVAHGLINSASLVQIYMLPSPAAA